MLAFQLSAFQVLPFQLSALYSFLHIPAFDISADWHIPVVDVPAVGIPAAFVLAFSFPAIGYPASGKFRLLAITYRSLISVF